MLDALQLVEDRWTTIMASREFDSPEGGKRAMRYVKLGIDTKQMPGTVGCDYPFTAFKLSFGEDVPGKSTFRVVLVTGLYVAPDQDGDGDVDASDNPSAAAVTVMDEIVRAVRTLADDGNYYPYSLEKIKWQLGDTDGDHPGPDHYIVAAELVLSQAPIF